MIERFFPTPMPPVGEALGTLLSRSAIARQTYAGILQTTHAHGVVVGLIAGAVAAVVVMLGVTFGVVLVLSRRGPCES